MAEVKDGERIYTIPLRGAYDKSLRVRSKRAVNIVRSFLKTHMKSDSVLIGKNLNEAIWKRGMKKPPRRVKVTAVKEGPLVKAELFGHKYEEFKASPKKERKGMKEKMLERLSPLAAKKEAEEKMIEGKEVKAEKQEVATETKTETKAEEKAEAKTEVKAETKEAKIEPVAAPASEKKEKPIAVAKGKAAKEEKAEN